jgi:hypothetical protein
MAGRGRHKAEEGDEAGQVQSVATVTGATASEGACIDSGSWICVHGEPQIAIICHA